MPWNHWPNTPPGETKALEPERDFTKPEDRLIAGRKIIKLGNVSTPTISVFRPPADKDNGACVVICPGGGFHILAWDLEGTEVAEWLNSIGVTAVVLKYRVPARNPDKRWEAAVQDAQRAMCLVRSKASDWNIDPRRIGILGFSAGGCTAGYTAIFDDQKQYAPVDGIDQVSSRPDFAILVYAAYFVDESNTALRPELKVTERTPPMFFAHAFDDRVRVENSLLLAAALKKAGVDAELHVYSTGGHGFGLRPTDESCTRWSEPCAEWLRREGFLRAVGAQTSSP